MKTDPVLVVMMTVAMIALYFTPWLVALWRKHEREKSVFYINFFFGWTLLGWVIALVWAMAGQRRARLVPVVAPQTYPDEFTAKHGPRPRYDRTQRQRPAKARRI